MTQLELAPRPGAVKFADDAFLAQALEPKRKVSLPALRSTSNIPVHEAAQTPYETIDCDALVIGCGVAGNATALRLANRGVRVTVLAAADDPHNCATFWAQGGIIYKSADDTPALLASDVHRAGAGVCDDAAVQKLATEGPTRVEELLLDVANVPFARNAATGALQLTLEASHNRARILYKADHTGEAIATSMVAAVRKHSNITLVTGRSAFELVTDPATGNCIGALTVATADNALALYRAPFTLLATGGVGDVFANTSNPDGARGEGLGLAARVGATLANMQYVQFHPTTLFVPGERRFLLTEALRGEGAKLRDGSGRAFATDYHPDGELAPRDVVARLILAEMAKQQANCMYLDISHKDPEWVKSRFPTIFAHCLARGIDMTKDPMPVVPAAHYHCGGVAVDLHGRTSVNGLYAAGEVSCTGVHGANRLASTSLLEGLVWGCAAADDFLDNRDEFVSVGDVAKAPCNGPIAPLSGLRDAPAAEMDEVLRAVQRIMWEDVGPKRTKRGMARAVDKLALLEAKAERLYRDCVVTRQSAGLRNAVRAAKEIASAALLAPKSIGTHYIVPDDSE